MRLYKFCIGVKDIDYLFNTGDMSIKMFTQNFVTSYDFIDKMNPYSDTLEGTIYGSYLGYPLPMKLKFSFEGYHFESEYGWELTIFDTPMSQDEEGTIFTKHNKITCSISLTKKKSTEEIKFGD